MNFILKASQFSKNKRNALFPYPDLVKTQFPTIVLSINHFFKFGFYVAIIPYKFNFDEGKRCWSRDRSWSGKIQKVRIQRQVDLVNIKLI